MTVSMQEKIRHDPGYHPVVRWRQSLKGKNDHVPDADGG
jgi:hypothetical protein